MFSKKDLVMLTHPPKYKDLLLTILMLSVLSLLGQANAQDKPKECIDYPPIDGWGWDGNESCRIERFVASPSECLDEDGDGWGWNGVDSCLIEPQDLNVTTPQTITELPCIDTDGDGWGWNGATSCDPVNSLAEVDDTRSADTDLINSCSGFNGENITNLVTDVILTAGQSNATGYNTLYEPEIYDEDKVSPRLIAWTENYGWQAANPQTQLWDAENMVPNVPGSRVAYNHPAFQTGKSILSEDPCRVVAIIATSAPGREIAHWLNNVNNHFDVVNNKVEAALQALANKSKIDMMWWMQGESNNRLPVDEYTSNLDTLIGEFRELSWFGNDKYFLANETRIAKTTNKSIRALRGNGDLNTDYSAGEDECNLCVEVQT